MKNVLFIVYYFPPMGGSGVQRPLKFVKYLRDFGWNPIVLCPEPGAYHTFDESLQEELESLNLEIYRVKAGTPFHKGGKTQRKVTLPPWLDNAMRRISMFFWLPDNKTGWIGPAVQEAIKITNEKKIEIIFSTAAPYSNHIIARVLKQKLALPVVMDLRDEWLESHLIHYATPFHRNKMAKIEKETLSKADCITVINKETQSSISHRFNDSDVRLIRQGFDPEDFLLPQETHRNHKKLRFLYSGLFYGKRKPDIFLKAVNALIDEKPWLKDIIELQFQGGLPKETIGLIQQLALSDIVTDYGYVNHKIAVRNLMNADILWFMVGHLTHSDKVTVGKMFEYFGTGKPILGLVPEGGAKELLKSYKSSYITNPYSEAGIKDAIESILSDWNDNALPSPNQGFIQKYDRKEITRELADIFNEISTKSL